MPIDARQLELTAEFCRIAGKADLVEYLGLMPGCTVDEAQEALRRKRKYMQGMQANPKYKNEALLFIKNFATFQAVLADPAAYAREVQNRHERANLPVLEMSIKAALQRGGDLSPEQVEYLKRNASELGIGEDTFIGTLSRLTEQSGVKVTTKAPEPPLAGTTSPPPPRGAGAKSAQVGGAVPPPPPVSARSVAPNKANAADSVPDDPYAVLGAKREMPLAEIRELYHDRLRRARTLPKGQAETVIAKLEAAWDKLANQATPADLSRRSTGPPARDRDQTDPQGAPTSPLAAPTAPPVRQRSTAPARVGSEEFTPAHSGAAPVGPRRMRGPTLPPIPIDGGPVAGFPGGAAGDEVEIRGGAVRPVKVGDLPISIPLAVDVRGDFPPGARVSTDEPWLTAQPSRLEPGHKEHEVIVRIDPAAMSGNASGTVTVQTDRGGRAQVAFEVERTTAVAVPVWVYVAVGVVVLVLALVVVYMLATFVLA